MVKLTKEERAQIHELKSEARKLEIANKINEIIDIAGVGSTSGRWYVRHFSKDGLNITKSPGNTTVYTVNGLVFEKGYLRITAYRKEGNWVETLDRLHKEIRGGAVAAKLSVFGLVRTDGKKATTEIGKAPG